MPKLPLLYWNRRNSRWQKVSSFPLGFATIVLGLCTCDQISSTQAQATCKQTRLQMLNSELGLGVFEAIAYAKRKVELWDSPVRP